MEIDIGKMIQTAIQFVIDLMNKGVKSLINTFNDYIIGIPAPGNPTDLSTWSEGQNEWEAVYSVYGIMTALAIALLTPSFMVAIDTVDQQQRRAYFIELSKAAFFIILGIPVTAFCLHLGNEVSQALAPGSLEFLATLGKLSNLGIGIIFGSILIYTKGMLVAIGLLCTMLIRLLIYISVAFWPIFWAFRVQPQETIKGYGHMGLSLFPLLILLKFTQAGILRFLFEIPYGGSGSALFKLVATTGGLAIALIGLPYATIVKLVPGSAMLLNNIHKDKIKVEMSGNGQGGMESDDDSGSQSQYGVKYHGPKSENPDPRPTNRPADQYGHTTSRGPRSRGPTYRSSNRPPRGTNRHSSSGSRRRGSGNSWSSSDSGSSNWKP